MAGSWRDATRPAICVLQVRRASEREVYLPYRHSKVSGLLDGLLNSRGKFLFRVQQCSIYICGNKLNLRTLR